MGDMGEVFNAMKADKKERRDKAYRHFLEWYAGTLTQKEREIFIPKSNPYHFHVKMPNGVINYWPSANKWTYKGDMYYGKPENLLSFVRNRL